MKVMHECKKKAFIITQVPAQFKNHRLWQNILLEDVMLENNKAIPQKNNQNQKKKKPNSLKPM
jgi:hypothetical protein